MNKPESGPCMPPPLETKISAPTSLAQETPLSSDGSQALAPGFRCGIVALIGRPNVGKSTLMNFLIGDKISIITPVAQTTRNQIRGIQTLPHAQIVYLDTPGIHAARTALNRYMVDVAMSSLEGVDLILYLVDSCRPDPAVISPHSPTHTSKNPGFREDASLLHHLKSMTTPCFLVVNKVDAIAKKEKLLPLIHQYAQGAKFAEVLPISALTGEGTDLLLSRIIATLPEAPPLFPPDFATDQAERFLVSEIIREKVILHTRQELPHSTAVLIDSFDESEREDDSLPADTEMVDQGALANHPSSAHKGEAQTHELHGLVRIYATIVVERDSQKGIVIGKHGAMLKEVGTQARKEIELLLGCRVWLNLWVKVEKNWSHHPHTLKRLGYTK